MVTQTDLVLGDGRTRHAYEVVADAAEGRLAVVWHHGTPNVGAPPEPLFPAAAVAGVADALGIEQFAVMGHSGGAAHALACAALLPQRVLAAVCASGMAPYHAQGLDWFAGMGRRRGGTARRRHRPRGPGGPPGLGRRPGRDGGRRPGQCRPLGGSTRHRSARRCCSCTAVRIGWCPARTASGWPAGPPRRS